MIPQTMINIIDNTEKKYSKKNMTVLFFDFGIAIMSEIQVQV